MKKESKLEKLPQFDLPVPFIADDCIAGDILSLYRQFPCKVEACIFAICKSGSLRARINLWEYTIKENDLVILPPGSFIQIFEIKENTVMAFVGFSSGFAHKMGFWKLVPQYINLFLNHPVFSLLPEEESFFSDALSLCTRAQQISSFRFTEDMVGHVMRLFIGCIDELHRTQVSKSHVAPSRDEEIMGEFLQLALENYREEHKISFYAQEAGLTLSHFCNVISRVSGQTAQEIIKSLLIMDAKAQLKNTKSTVTQIAYSLGFHTPTTFNRYFRTYTGMTPQEYRNKE